MKEKNERNQMSDSTDPFLCLNLPRRFDLSRAQIDGAYFAKVEGLHPDAQTQVHSSDQLPLADPTDGEAALAVLNHARATLADPEKRAEALLVLLAPQIARSDIPLPPSFLMEIMELREAVDAAAASGDTAERVQWQQWGKHERQRLLDAVTHAFSTQDFRQVRSLLNEWRYVERLMEALRHTSAGN